MCKQPTCPSTDEWIKMLIYLCVCVRVSRCIYIFIHTRIWMGLEGIMLHEIHHTERGRGHVISLRCGLYQKTPKEQKQNKQTHAAKQNHQCGEQTGDCQRREVYTGQEIGEEIKGENFSYTLSEAGDQRQRAGSR